MSNPDTPFNYRYWIDLARQVDGPVLDYGCGIGQTVALGLSQGIDIWGTDTYAGHYTGWSQATLPEASARVRKIKDGRADFPDGHFSFLFANQVLEHVDDLEAALIDMKRLLRPGGTFMASFPVTETWYEGHLGVYVAHWFAKGSGWRDAYLSLAHRLGFGLYRDGLTREAWVRMSAKTLDEACFYRSRTHILAAIENTFGAKVEDVSAHYMHARLGARARSIPEPALRFIYHKRAGEIFSVKRPT